MTNYLTMLHSVTLKLVPLRLAYGAEVGPCCTEDFFLLPFLFLPDSHLGPPLLLLNGVCGLAALFPTVQCAFVSCTPMHRLPLLLVWHGARLTPLASAGEHLSFIVPL